MKFILISLLAGLISAVTFVGLNNHFNSKTIAVVRVDKLISDHLKEYGEKDLTDEKRKQLSGEFAKRLDKAIKKISETDGVILLVAPAVVSPVPDYTEIVRSEIGGVDGNQIRE